MLIKRIMLYFMYRKAMKRINRTYGLVNLWCFLAECEMFSRALEEGNKRYFRDLSAAFQTDVQKAGQARMEKAKVVI